MRIKSVTWRFWAAVAGALAGYGLLGFWLSSNGNAEEWLYRIGLTIASLIPLLYAGIYTAFGLSSREPSAKWWKTPLGTAFVLAALSIEPTTAPLAYVFWFMGGMLRASWLAWVEVSGPCLSAIAWLRICHLWVRMRAMEIAASTYREPGSEVAAP